MGHRPELRAWVGASSAARVRVCSRMIDLLRSAMLAACSHRNGHFPGCKYLTAESADLVWLQF